MLNGENEMYDQQKYLTPHRDRWQRKASWISVLMFVIGATTTIDYSLVGRVTVAETIAFLMIPYFWMTSHRSYINANFKKSITLLALMFLGTAVADFINQNYFLFSARALARPVFMVGYLLFFIPVLSRDPLSLVYMVYGKIIAGIVNYFRPSEFQTEGAADAANYAGVVFRVQPLIGALVIAFAVFIYPRSRILAALSFLAGGAAAVAVGGARSSILIWVLAAGVLITIKFFKSARSKRIILTKTRLAGLVTVALLGLTSVYAFYLWAAPRGVLGEVQERKILQQQNTVFGASPLGFVLAGRPQVYGAILGVMDRPILGFGSWRHDLTSPYVVEAIGSVGTDPKVMDQLASVGGTGGAGHSILFATWVQNGLMPAVSVVLMFVIMLKVGLFNIRYENRLTPFFLYSIIAFCWAFFFSPPGIGFRFDIGLFLAFYVVFMDRKGSLAQMAVLK